MDRSRPLNVAAQARSARSEPTPQGVGYAQTEAACRWLAMLILGGPRKTKNYAVASLPHALALGVLFAVLGLSSLAGCQSTQGASGRVGPLETWCNDESRELSTDAMPVRENEIFSATRKTIRLRAARNDIVAFQLAARSDSGGGAIDIRMSDLIGPSGTLPSREHVKLYRAQPVKVSDFRSWYPAHTGRIASPIDVLDILVPWDAPRGGGPLPLHANQTEFAWVDVIVTSAVQPGTYRGAVEIRRTSGIFVGSDAPAQTYTLELEVAPVEIPSEVSIPVVCRIDPRDLLAAHLGWPSESAEETRLLPDVSSHTPAIRLVNSTMQLFHDHRCTPVLLASFPKYKPTDDNAVAIDWAAYDALVEGFIDGSAFADKAPSAVWPLPISAGYPDADVNGGFDSPRYARLLAGFASACREHFAERAWLDRAFVRVLPPRPLTEDVVGHTRRVLGILRESQTKTPLVAHFGPGSLRGLGWYNAPSVELPGLGSWCPPANQWEPERLADEGGLDEHRWFVPSSPPYSPSLNVESPAADVRALAWQAFRYDSDGIWIEDASRTGRGGGLRTFPNRAPEALVYPGQEFGVVHTPIPSVRLKRLRRSVLDHQLLTLLDHSGKSLLAKRTAEQVVRWGFTDACTRNLVTTREAGWAADPYVYSLARNVLLQELGAAPDAGSSETESIQTAWARFMNQGVRLQAEPAGARLEETDEGLLAHIYATLANQTSVSMSGTWELPEPPPGWTRLSNVETESSAQSRSLITISHAVNALNYNAAGLLETKLLFRGDAGESSAITRLAVTACPLVDKSPEIDGDLSDWAMAPTNAAGDFRLVRGEGAVDASGRGGVPANATRAFFCMDDKRLYIAIFCATQRGESPIFRADNQIPIDGAIPWGQDLIEILLSPRNARAGGGAELNTLQIKPSGVVVSRKGALTDPPMNPSEIWQSGVQVAARADGEGWTVELSIPFAALDPAALKNRIWGCNITRLDARRGEYSSWSAARGNAYSPETLGNLLLQRP